MMRWAAVIFLGLTIFSIVFFGLAKLGVGRVPGARRFKLVGQIICLPFGSAVVWALLAFVIAELA